MATQTNILKSILQICLQILPDVTVAATVPQQAEHGTTFVPPPAPARFMYVPEASLRSGEYAMNLFLTKAALGCTKQMGADRMSPDTRAINLEVFQNKTCPLWTEIAGNTVEDIIFCFFWFLSSVSSSSTLPAVSTSVVRLSMTLNACTLAHARTHLNDCCILNRNCIQSQNIPPNPNLYHYSL